METKLAINRITLEDAITYLSYGERENYEQIAMDCVLAELADLQARVAELETALIAIAGG